MKWSKIFLLSLWGGGASIVTSNLVALWSKLIANPPPLLAGLVSIMVFLIVGMGVTISLRMAIASDNKSKEKLLLGGLTGGALYGLFSPLGVLGYHIAIIAFPIGVALFMEKGRKIRTASGGIIGGLLGAFVSTIGTITFVKYFGDIVQTNLIPYVVLFYNNFITIYFLNLGMLIALLVKKKHSP